MIVMVLAVVILVIVVTIICVIICIKKYKIVKGEEKGLTFASIQTPTTHRGEIEKENGQGNHNDNINVLEGSRESNQELYGGYPTNRNTHDDSLTPSDDEVEIRYDVDEKDKDKDKASLSEIESDHDRDIDAWHIELAENKKKNINARDDDNELRIKIHNDEFNHDQLQTDIDANMGGQIEGLDLNDDNGARAQTCTYLDINNWKEWDKNEVKEWIRETLKSNKIDDDEINQFMSNVFEKMSLTGKIIMALKTNNQYWKKFQNDIENYSLGIWIAIDIQIQGLPTDHKRDKKNNKLHD